MDPLESITCISVDGKEKSVPLTPLFVIIRQAFDHNAKG